MKKLVIIGGYGNGTVVQSTVEDINAISPTWELLGFLNDNEVEPINGLPVLGKIDFSTAQRLLQDPDVFFFFSLISVKLNHTFIHRLKELEIPQDRFATIVHPTAVVSKFAEIGFGTCVQPFVSIGPNVRIGNHVQIFAQAMIGHGAQLHDCSYVATNAVVGADVELAEGAYLGTNSTTLEFVRLGRWSLVGIGAVVLKDVPEYAKVVGNPARQIGTTR